jgi:uncharacterized protein with ParB-like and HNH nuclease domain
MITSTEQEISVEDTEQDEEIYVDYDIATYPSDNTLMVLNQMWDDGDIEIPDFQRGFVWNIKQSSLLVESFLRGLPVPPVFFFIDADNKNLVVDGQQRLLSVLFFYEGYFGPENKSGKRQVFKLSGLNEKSRYLGKTYKDLGELDRRKFDSSVLRAVNIRQLSPNSDNSSVYHIFERLNTGGTPLSAQEIRNTVYRGMIVKKLNGANENPNWRSVIGKSAPDKRGRDVEMVLRLLGLFSENQQYEAPMKRFLNNAMSANRKALTSKGRRFFEIFPDVCEHLIRELGERPFSPKGPLNVAILDAIFVALANRWPAKPRDLDQKVTALIANAEFTDLYSSRTADTEVVRRRLRIAQQTLHP